jgi:hypothetical protein
LRVDVAFFLRRVLPGEAVVGGGGVFCSRRYSWRVRVWRGWREEVELRIEGEGE